VQRAKELGVTSTPEEWTVRRTRVPYSPDLGTVCMLDITEKWTLAYLRSPWGQDTGMYIMSVGFFGRHSTDGIGHEGFARTVADKRVYSASDLAAYLFPAMQRARNAAADRAAPIPGFATLVEQARAELEQWDEQIAGLPHEPDPPAKRVRGLDVPMILLICIAMTTAVAIVWLLG
jgi:hypothetical protein